MMIQRVAFVALGAFVVCGASACNSGGDAAATAPVASQVGSSTSPTQTAPTQGPSPGSFSTCVSSDPQHLCIGLNVVSYADTSGTPVVSSSAAEHEIQTINDIWKQCNVSFQIDAYQSVDPAKLGLPTGANVQNGLTQIRQQFETNNQFLVVLTDSWQSNTVGWTEMPGGSPLGAILDGDWVLNGPSGEGDETLAHELGHYQGLGHVSDTTNLMNPSALPTSNTLTSDQCATVTSTDQSVWTAMLRH